MFHVVLSLDIASQHLADSTLEWEARDLPVEKQSLSAYNCHVWQGVLLWKMLKAVGVPVQEGQEHSSAQNCPERFGHILTTIQYCPICLPKGQTSDNLIFNQRWNHVLMPARMSPVRSWAVLQEPCSSPGPCSTLGFRRCCDMGRAQVWQTELLVWGWRSLRRHCMPWEFCWPFS